MQEKWESIENYNGKYEVSNMGRVKSLCARGERKSAFGYMWKYKN